jgi:hypothetical protein
MSKVELNQTTQGLCVTLPGLVQLIGTPETLYSATGVAGLTLC